MHTPSRRLVLLLVATVGAVLVAGPAFAGKKPPKKRKGDLIAGSALNDKTGEPVVGAMIELYPVEPKGKKSDVTIYTDLLGVDTTTPTGRWSVEVLSSPAAFVEFGLLRGWDYEIVVTAPGYYQLRSNLEFLKGTNDFTLKLEPKVSDVVDETGVVQGNSEPAFMSRGKVVRGN